MGALSPRDTSRGTVGELAVMVDYSRPSKRGRKVWGDVVPWGRVWRLGADFATHVVFSTDARIGDADVAAGTYTLWMLPDERGTSQLIINRQTRIFGTNYNPSHDLVRIPLRREAVSPAIERLVVEVEAGRLWIRWDDLAWSVALARR
jgi:hypothetical protein